MPEYLNKDFRLVDFAVPFIGAAFIYDDAQYPIARL